MKLSKPQWDMLRSMAFVSGQSVSGANELRTAKVLVREGLLEPHPLYAARPEGHEHEGVLRITDKGRAAC